MVIVDQLPLQSEFIVLRRYDLLAVLIQKTFSFEPQLSLSLVQYFG